MKKIVFTFAVSLALAGCTASWEDQHAYMVSAAPLFPLKPPDGAPPLNYKDDDPKAYLGALIVESQGKCDTFLTRLTVAETSGDTGLDMANGVFSALGTAFKPLSTVHALTAGASITSGWKTAIDSDFYAKQAIGNYQQAIQATYYSDIQAYATALKTTKDTIILPIEVSNIQRIHAECSLESAQHTISANLQSSGATPNGNGGNTKTLTIAGTLTSGEVLSLTAHASALPNGEVTVNAAALPASPKASDAVAALVAAVNANPDLKKAGISAAPSGGSAVVLSWPTSLSLTWDPPVGGPAAAAQTTGNLSQNFVAHVPQKPFGKFGPTTTGATTTTLTGAVPGHKLTQ